MVPEILDIAPLQPWPASHVFLCGDIPTYVNPYNNIKMLDKVPSHYVLDQQTCYLQANISNIPNQLESFP